MKVSVVIASSGGPNLKECEKRCQEADEVIVVNNPDKQLVDNTNDGYKQSTGDIIVYLFDRVLMKEGWRDEMMKRFEKIQFSGVVSFTEKPMTTHGAISRDYCEKHQGDNLLWPEYIHYYADFEVGEKSRQLLKHEGLLEYCFIIPRIPTPGEDERGDNMVQWDKKVFYHRQKLGFPPEITLDMEERNRNVYLPARYRQSHHV